MTTTTTTQLEAQLDPHELSRGLRPAALMSALLVENYRSHATLLDLPSRLFYGDRLIASADQGPLAPPRWVPGAADLDLDSVHRERLRGSSSTGTSHHPRRPGVEEVVTREVCHRPGSPLAFVGVLGRHMRSADVPSFYNPAEVTVVGDIVAAALRVPPALSSTNHSHDHDHHISPPPILGGHWSSSDVGVVAPYRKQVQKIREELRRRGLAAVRVGTVHDFQGQESRVLVVSTVLTRPTTPLRGRIGSNSNSSTIITSARRSKSGSRVKSRLDPWSLDAHYEAPQRFNVAVSRARSLLIVVGHPVALAADAVWRPFLEHVTRLGSWTGAGWTEQGVPILVEASGSDGGSRGGGGHEGVDGCASHSTGSLRGWRSEVTLGPETEVRVEKAAAAAEDGLGSEWSEWMSLARLELLTFDETPPEADDI